MGGLSITEQFSQEGAQPPPQMNPIDLAKNIVATGEVNATAAAGLSDRHFQTFEDRLERIVLENARWTDNTLDGVQAGIARNKTPEAAQAYLEGPQGSRMLQDPVMRQIIIDYVGAPDKDAARPAADAALRARLQEWDTKMPGIMSEIQAARTPEPEQVTPTVRRDPVAPGG